MACTDEVPGPTTRSKRRKWWSACIFHAEHHPDLTVGVVAFSEAQATCIQYQLEAVRRERQDLDSYFQDSRLDGFFIKNLESVQGDERDIIIFSIGFGKDENDKFTMNFGPVGQEGGYRRLNVAITRARSRVEVISSVRASDFRDTANVNINHLRGYLDFAERGMAALTPITAGEGEPESPFEVAVLDVGARLGLPGRTTGRPCRVSNRHGHQASRAPGHWLLGIECDGAAYHSSRTARDRDRLRQEVLEISAGGCTASGVRAGITTVRIRRRGCGERSRRPSLANGQRPRSRRGLSTWNSTSLISTVLFRPG